ncbi:unnamed protein product [Dibothriocephalus latus]|uniref:Uncharacterized protein n=1 Tax=Dibothriocephalus latus TaxID=60516 RepID=A0A3P7N8K5_DIBLA|nr:unnamed protein product [Dibothriocephalus latus]
MAAFQDSCSFSGISVESVERPDLKCLLIYAVFVAVLKRFNMKFAFVDFEADNAVAELAIKLQCPVMSRDSDYFIFTNYWGDCGNYCCIQPIPFNASPKAFANGVCKTCTVSANSQKNSERCCYYLETTCFRPDQGSFSRLAAPLRPVFSVLCGNDYAPSGYFDLFSSEFCHKRCEVDENGFGYLRSSLIEDVRYSESAYMCARPLRQVIYSVLSQLAGDDKRGLRGLQGDSKNPYVQEVLRDKHMGLAVTKVILLKADLDSPQQMLKLHLGLQRKQSGLPNSLHSLVGAAFIVLTADQRKGQHSEGQRSPSSVASSPLVLAALAVSTAAFVLHQQETPQQKPEETWKVLSDRIQQQLSMLIPDDSSFIRLNFAFLHTYAQLQIAYATLVTLGDVLTANMPSSAEDHEEVGSLDTVSSCFPSGRRVHRLAVRLDHLSEVEREKEVCEVIFPRLLGRTSMRSFSQLVLSRAISTYTKVIRFLDGYLKDQKKASASTLVT